MALSSVISLMMLVAQSDDPVRRARVDYTRCLRGHVIKSLKQKMPPEEFGKTMSAECSKEEGAFRTIVTAAARSDGLKASEAEQDATDQITDYHDSFTEQYGDHLKDNTTPE